MPNKKPRKKISVEKRKILFFFQTFLSQTSLLTKILLGLGTIFIIIPLFFYINEFVQLSFFTPKIPQVVQKHFSRLVEIQIPSVDMDLSVEETAISGNTWQIANNGISHLAISSSPGENGPIILYGHNTNDRFGPIRWLSTNENIFLKTADGKTHAYKIIKTVDVNPDKTSIFSSEKGETLFLYTCDGFADLQRFIVVAKPV